MHPSAPLSRALFLAAVALVLAPLGASAQDRAKLRNDMERLRANTVGMVEAMPAAGLRTAPTEGVRDFAEQIEHVAVGAVNIVASGLDTDAVSLGDKDVYLNDKAELVAMVNGAFAQVDGMLAAMSDAELGADGMLFGQVPTPKWAIVQAAHEHGVWTLGATVPYLRLQGGTPPGFDLVPAFRGN